MAARRFRRWIVRVWAVGVALGIVATSAAWSAHAADEPAIALVRDGEPSAVIAWWGSESSPTPGFAASELQSYVERMSGARVRIVEGHLTPGDQAATESGMVIATGGSAAKFRHNSAIPRDWVSPAAEKLTGKRTDAFVITTVDDDKLVLAGSNERGTLYAAYELLERLGVRFFAPRFDFYEGNAERVPRVATIGFDPLTVVEEASLRFRRKYVEDGYSHTVRNLPQLIDWMAKARLNVLVYPYDYNNHGVTKYDSSRDAILPELVKRGIVTEVGGHGFNSWLPAEKYPQYYISGYNVFDVTNEQALQTYIDNVVGYLEQRPEIQIFDAWPPDSARWSPTAVEKFGSISNAYAYVIRRLTETVKQKLPGVVIEALSYRPATEPPSPEYMYDKTANIVDIAPYDRSYKVPIYDPSAETNAYYNDLIKRWHNAYDGSIGIYEYYRKYSWHSLPCTMPNLIAQEIPYYQSIGGDGLGMFSEPGDWISYEVAHALVAAQSWNKGLDTREWSSTYLSDRYGAAQDDMATYLGKVESACRTIFITPGGDYSNPEAVSQALNDFKSASVALAAAADAVPDDSSARFVIDRLVGSAARAVADTEISAYELAGDTAKMADAKLRMADLTTAHTFDGVVVKNIFTLRRYVSGQTNEGARWVYGMYRRHDLGTEPPAGTADVSDLPWLWAANGLGPVEKDTSNGGEAAGDGGPITIRGKTYAKGLGVHPYSEVGYHLGGACARFTARVGIDDEAGGEPTPPGDGDADMVFEDGWDFRNHSGAQVVNGSPAGTPAVLGTTDAAESSDPSWVQSPTADDSGSKPEVLSFDGEDDVVTLTGTDSVNLSAGFVYETWVNQRTRGVATRLMQRHPAIGFWINTDGTVRVNATSKSGVLFTSWSTDQVPLGAWTHVGLVYDVDGDQSKFRLFIGGKEVRYFRQEILTGAPTLGGEGSPLLVGNWQASTRGFDGLIAYARLITPNDAADSWNLGVFPPITKSSVIFQVWADDRKVYDSGVVTSATSPRDVDVPVSGARKLRLVVLDAFDGSNDEHADWANPKVTCQAG
ncbi:MAG: DUF4838 domain-containing protein [Actinobacteria bacterium]|nr:DUF4838 domain-containing protein [Actinomycetota bacterium]